MFEEIHTGKTFTDPQAVINNIDNLLQLRERQLSLLLQLKLWASVQLQGIDPSTVKGFGFDEFLLTKKEHFQYSMMGKFRCLYNYVLLQDGTKKQLSPMLDIPPKENPQCSSTM